ncbi:MAG: M28 family peptidase [Clostridiales bacterium]|nr:M28 family peptidase [Clostridiales bacterium]
MENIEKHMHYPVSKDRLMNDLYAICQWERLSGTAEELKAFHYVEKQLKAVGAETQLIFHDAYISLPVSGKLVVNGRDYACHTASMAKSTPPEGVVGQLVYAGGEPEAITAELCRGKIVVLGGAADFHKIHKAWKAGARGVVGCPGEYIHEKIISNAWGSPTPTTRDLIPDIPYVSVTQQLHEEIVHIAQTQLVDAHLTTVVDTGWRKIPLLFADIRANEPTDDFVLFSGHLDSWYVGATDNGTANCIQIEAALIASMHRDEMKRNLKLAFYSGHSHGRYAGSAWHADNDWLNLHKHCVLNINADIIGGVGATDLTRSIIMPEIKDVAAAFIKAHTGIDFGGGRCGRNGDQSYYIHGVSSAFSSFSKQPRPENPENKLAQTRSGAFDFGWWWHTAEDTVDKVDPDFFLRDAKIFISFALYVLTQPAIPLNFCKAAKELQTLVQYWIERAGDRFDLSLPQAQAQALAEATSGLYAQAPADIDAFNRLQMALGRILVPLNYTTGNLYENDTAIPQPPMPSLKLIDELVKTPAGSAESYDILTELGHRRNFVIDSFDRALSLVNGYLAEQR